MFAPLSFLLAAFIASATAFSYAELSARYPRSAGEATYVLAAFNSRSLSIITGWLIVLTGVVSAATLANGFVGYFQIFIPFPGPMIIVLVIIALGLLAIWGIEASMNVAVTITLIEILGLLIVVAVAGVDFTTLPARLPELMPGTDSVIWTGILAGTFLAFYAFIGFEDMVNVAEEVHAPSSTIPKAIFLAMGISTLLYVVVAVVAVLNVPVSQLASSAAPFAMMMEREGYSATLISMISLISIVNGALVQIIMASRVLYGMADQGNGPAWMAVVNRHTRTPVNTTVLVTVVIVLLALALSLISLAKATSFIVLSVFALVNVAMIRVKMRYPAPEHVTAYPIILPILATLLCLGLLSFSLFG